MSPARLVVLGVVGSIAYACWLALVLVEGAIADELREDLSR